VDHALEQDQAALIVLDIDHFKQVNDAYGHPTGDAVICALIARIRDVLQGKGSIGRVGGEEFTILLDGYTVM
ncbi:diguanylate cyclase, partial [Pectobacterium versatile]|nr:diguanylate cyclase [Pectobacterium versatile]